jgi:hypothetical protein
MKPSSQSASSTLPTSDGFHRAGRSEDLAYQAMTVGAILAVLVSMWVF